MGEELRRRRAVGRLSRSRWESTGVVLIEAAVGMIAELFPHNGPIDAPARRFNALIVGRYERISSAS